MTQITSPSEIKNESNEFEVLLSVLDDPIITATSESGEELLRFVVNWGNHKIRCRMPTLGQWDMYCQDMALLLRQLGSDFDTIDIPYLDRSNEIRIKDWAHITALFLENRKIGHRIVELFLKYLRPEIEGITDFRVWLYDNVPIDGIMRLFCALLMPDQMLKKNARSILSRVFQILLAPPSTHTSTTNGDGPKKNRIDTQSSSFISFWCVRLKKRLIPVIISTANPR